MIHGAANTGRIQQTLTASARRILFEGSLGEQIDEDLPIICQIDYAHLMMLARQGIIASDIAKRLMTAIAKLASQAFQPLRSRIPLRGVFLLYEEYLIETEGHTVGGVLQTARSRNDLNATLLKIRLRKPYAELLRALFRLEVILLRRAELYQDVVMPAYTHGQAAEPITFGHYLSASAQCVCRDIQAVIEAVSQLQVCPLGAGAIAGTSLPIDTALTSRLLGFDSAVSNSIDAVASRDMIYRLLAAMAILGTTLSRISTDLLQWLTAEFSFLALPDELVGSSSAMPQKRNPFLLEHVQGRTASALGAFTHALSSSRAMPLTNCIAVGTEAMRPVWKAIADTTESVTLLRLVVSSARPNPSRMLARAIDGGTIALALTNYLVVTKGLDFRSAHRRIGQLFRDLGPNSNQYDLKTHLSSDPDFDLVSDHELDPRLIVKQAAYGGGPALASIRACLAGTRHALEHQHGSFQSQLRSWRSAEHELQTSMKHFIAV